MNKFIFLKFFIIFKNKYVKSNEKLIKYITSIKNKYKKIFLKENIYIHISKIKKLN